MPDLAPALGNVTGALGVRRRQRRVEKFSDQVWESFGYIAPSVEGERSEIEFGVVAFQRIKRDPAIERPSLRLAFSDVERPCASVVSGWRSVDIATDHDLATALCAQCSDLLAKRFGIVLDERRAV